MSLGVGKHNTGLRKAASPYSCFIIAGISKYSFVLIRRQKFDIVYEKCIMLNTKVFICDMSEKCVMEKCCITSAL